MKQSVMAVMHACIIAKWILNRLEMQSVSNAENVLEAVINVRFPLGRSRKRFRKESRENRIRMREKHGV